MVVVCIAILQCLEGNKLATCIGELRTVYIEGSILVYWRKGLLKKESSSKETSPCVLDLQSNNTCMHNKNLFLKLETFCLLFIFKYFLKKYIFLTSNTSGVTRTSKSMCIV